MAYKIYQQLESGMAGKGLINANAVDAVSPDGSIKPLPQVLDELGGGDYVAVATITERDAISSPKDGLVCYVRATNQEYRYDAERERWKGLVLTITQDDWDDLTEDEQDAKKEEYDVINITNEDEGKSGKCNYLIVETKADMEALLDISNGCVCYVNEEREEYRYNASKSQWYEIDKTFNSTEWDELGEEGQQEAYGLYTNIYVTEE